MTIPVSGGTNITRADAAGSFAAEITTPVNAISKWRTENNPAGTNLYVVIRTRTESIPAVEGSQSYVVANPPVLGIRFIRARFNHVGTGSEGDVSFEGYAEGTSVSFTGTQINFTLSLTPPDTFIGPTEISYYQTDTSGTAGTPIVQSTTPSPLSSNLLAGNTVTTSPTAAEIALGNLDLSNLATLLQNAAIVCSRARSVRLRKYYNATYIAGSPTPPASTLVYDVTNVAHLSSAWQLGSTGVANPAAGDVDASAFNSFISQLETAVTTHRNTVVNFTEQWCHSSCHTNHSSRNRR